MPRSPMGVVQFIMYFHCVASGFKKGGVSTSKSSTTSFPFLSNHMWWCEHQCIWAKRNSNSIFFLLPSILNVRFECLVRGGGGGGYTSQDEAYYCCENNNQGG
jgi:hypothetical protein